MYNKAREKYSLIFHGNFFFLQGPLLNHIMKRGRLTEREASLIVRDIANGLNFLHSKGMSHRFVLTIGNSNESKRLLIYFF